MSTTAIQLLKIVRPRFLYGKTTFYLLIGCIILQSAMLHAQPPELIGNGDFSSGNSGFTSDYIYCNSQNCLYPEGYYAVGTDPTYSHSDFLGSDHTTGTGNLLIVNGSGTPNTNVWCETIPVSSNVTYTFSYWLSSLVTATPAMLQVNLNGSTAGSVFTAPSDLYEWDQFSVDWYSGANTSVSICIVNQNTAPGGNDFGLDDISFREKIDEVVCPLPTNISVSDITGSSAKLSWDEVAGAEGYKVRYRVTGTNSWTLKYKFSPGASKTLNNLSPNTSYTWEVKTYCTINPGWSSDWSAKQKFTTGPLRISSGSVQQTTLGIYPNPAADQATIHFSLPQSSHTYIYVYDVSGKEIGALLNGDLEQGDHSLTVNIDHFSKGVYLVRLITDAGIENQKLIVQ